MAFIPTTWNPSDKQASSTLSSGNLRAALNGGSVRSIWSAVSGKYYFEFKFAGSTGQMVGVATSAANIDSWPGADAYGWALERATGYIYTGGGAPYSGASGGTTISVLLDLDNKKLQFKRNNANLGPAIDLPSGVAFYAICGYYDTVIANFGATAFTYAVPTGYTAGFGETTGLPANIASETTLDDATPLPFGLPTAWSPTDKASGVTLLTPLHADFGYGGMVRSIHGVESGKWYWEVYPTGEYPGSLMAGVALKTASVTSYWPGYDDKSAGYENQYGNLYYKGVIVATGLTNIAVMGFQLDADARTLRVFADGVEVVTADHPDAAYPIVVPVGKLYALAGYGGAGIANFGGQALRHKSEGGYSRGFGLLEPNLDIESEVYLDDVTTDMEIIHDGGIETINLDTPPGGYYGYGIDSEEWGWHEVTYGTSPIDPWNWESSEFGYGTTIENAFNIIDVEGWENDVAVGEPTVAEGSRRITVDSFGEAEWGDAHVQERYIYVDAYGIAPPPDTGPNDERQVPSANVEFRNKDITDVGGIEEEPISIEHSLTHWVQGVDQAGEGYFDEQVSEEAIVNYGVQDVYPFPIIGLDWGDTLVYRKVIVEPEGWDSSILPDNAELLINTRRVYHHSGELDPLRMGVTKIFNWRQDIDLWREGWESSLLNFPSPIVFNRLQIVNAREFMDNLPPDRWEHYGPFVENQHRILGTFGHQSSRFGISTLIYNNANPVAPAGLDATLWGRDTFIAYRHRQLPMQGWDSFYTTVYNIVRNGADVVGPVSAGDQSELGKPDPVLNLNRTIKHHSGWGGPEWGTAFVAPRVRSVASGLFYDIFFPIPEVRHNPHPLAPVGIPVLGQVGAHFLHIFKAEILPKPLNVFPYPRVGDAYIKNRNITVSPYAYEQTTFGVQDIQNRKRYIAYAWVMPDNIPMPTIADRRLYARPDGIEAVTQGILHRVRNDSPDPPSTQRVLLDDKEDGIPPPDFDQQPDIRLVTIFPEGFDEEHFGMPRAWSTTIETKVFGDTIEFGMAEIIFTRYLYPRVFEENYWQVSTGARLSPFTIYAPSSDAAPEGYTPWTGGQLMDELLWSWDLSANPWFGEANVAHQHRGIGPVPEHWPDEGLNGETSFGDANLTLRLQIVSVDGIRSLRMGYPVLWGVPQYVSLDDPLYDETDPDSTSYGNGIPPWNDFGLAEVALPPDHDQYISTEDNDWTEFGALEITLKNRRLFPEGIQHEAWDEYGWNNDPWGDALVGFPRKFEMSAGDQTLWGNADIDYKNRVRAMTGFNSCSLENFSFEDFKWPMKVVRRNPITGATSLGDTLEFGTPSVTFGVRTIYARGVAGYNSGSAKLSAMTYVLLTGWLSSSFGDIDRWEAGKIKAHGDELSTLGTPKLLHPLRPTGANDGVFPAPRMAFGAAPLSILSVVFAGPSVTNPFGCTNRVATPLPVISTQAVGVPTIS